MKMCPDSRCRLVMFVEQMWCSEAEFMGEPKCKAPRRRIAKCYRQVGLCSEHTQSTVSSSISWFATDKRCRSTECGYNTGLANAAGDIALPHSHYCPVPASDEAP
jgi:hypothetical protein